MHKYVPQLHVMETGTGSEVSTPRGCSFIFEEAEFYAVTSYQNKIVSCILSRFDLDHYLFL